MYELSWLVFVAGMGGIAGGWALAMWMADWRIRRSSMLDVHEKLDSISLRFDLVIEAIENMIEPKEY